MQTYTGPKLPTFDVAAWEHGITLDLSHKNWGGQKIRILKAKKKIAKKISPAITALTVAGDLARTPRQFEEVVIRMARNVAAGRGPLGDNDVPADEMKAYKRCAENFKQPKKRSRSGASHRKNNDGLELLTKVMMEQNNVCEFDGDDDEYKEEYI